MHCKNVMAFINIFTGYFFFIHFTRNKVEQANAPKYNGTNPIHTMKMAGAEPFFPLS